MQSADVRLLDSAGKVFSIGGYAIRTAELDEIPRLQQIEDEASVLFSGLGLILDESVDSSVPIENMLQMVHMGSVWVACAADDRPIGVVGVMVLDGQAYLEEIYVVPEHGRRGLGSALLEFACTWAHVQGHVAMTLSTFRDVHWNGPFYRKHGFRDLEPAEWTPGLHAIRTRETEQGLLVEQRVFMCRVLGGADL